MPPLTYAGFDDVELAVRLCSSQADVSLPEALDVLWLARSIAAAEPSQPYAPEAEAPGSATARESAPIGPAPGARTGHPARRDSGGADPLGGKRLQPHRGTLTAGGGTAEPLALAAAPARLDGIALARALQSLRRTRPSPVREVVDEVLSAELSAATGMVLPARRPAREPYYELTLVCDTGASMDLWEPLVQEAATAAARLRAFRSVTVRRLASDGASITLSGAGATGGFGELIEPNGRRVVAFLTDSVGAGWHDGRMAGHAHRLAGYGPVVVVHVLPPDMWPRTGVNPLPVFFWPAPEGATGPHHFAPAGGWQPDDIWPDGAPPGGGPVRAIPVVPLRPAPIGRWASLVSGERGRPVSGSAWLVGGGGRTVPSKTASTGVRQVAPRRRVRPARPGGGRAEALSLLRDFDATASPRARLLLRFLSAVPLNRTTLWLVHAAVARMSGEHHDPAPLAEVFLSGLLDRERTEAEGEYFPGAAEFEFVGGVRQVLMEGLERDELIRTYLLVADHVAQESDAPPLDFRGVLLSPAPEAPPDVRTDERLRPLVSIGALILRGLGPLYHVAASAYAEAAERGVGAGSAPRPGRAVGGGAAEERDLGAVTPTGDARTGGDTPSDDGALPHASDDTPHLSAPPAGPSGGIEVTASADDSATPGTGGTVGTPSAGAPTPAFRPQAPAVPSSAAEDPVGAAGLEPSARPAGTERRYTDRPPAPEPADSSGTVDAPPGNHRIAVIGAPQSGKTCFLGAAWLAALHAPRALGTWTVVPADASAERFIVQHTRSLAEELRFPGPTLAPEPFRYHFRGLLPPPADRVVPEPERRIAFTLSLYDAGGAEYGWKRYGREPQLDDHLATAQSLLVMVDPEGSRRQADYLAPHLARLARDLRRRGRADGGRLPHRVVMCVSKFDRPRVIEMARFGGWLNKDDDGFPCVLPGDAAPFAAWLAERVPDMAGVLDLVDHYFDSERVTWSVLSAIGFHRGPDGVLDLDDCSNETRDVHGVPMLKGYARPKNVLEPLIRLGRLHGED
ncbi:SAV_2336 N-terminal domain-related protein [Streptomyces longwoodensis]